MRRRTSTHPGIVLETEFLAPLRLSPFQFAMQIGHDVETINQLLSGQKGMTPELAEAFASALGTTSDFWLNLQTSFDETL